ncbi:MAG TPA: UDP-N-acetylmuramoyl-tripeptide--D-alanyl-D-alanine ligase [Bacteroidota bacterium]|nr:UDP-N-acetylmuramoyl-tripeptide--D-alanyl-D-alanine ligase [Bacteroidota bacterium]
MKLTLQDLKKLSSVEIHNGRAFKQKVTGVSTDSRSVKAGNIFIALRGEKFDGHHFIEEVLNRGAVAIIVDTRWRKENASLVDNLQKTVAVVSDTTKALGELARIYRKKFSIPILAIGGSNGKTTTKEMVGAVLRTTLSVLSTEGNLNNHIGVPQMLFRLESHHDVAVLELGTNHFGELDYLCGIAAPTHALITNIGREHLEFFGDEKGVAKEETALFRNIASKGFAFINADDGHLSRAGKKVKRSLTYGVKKAADLRARRVRTDGQGCPIFDISFKGKEDAVHLSVAGLHNATNALAAAAVGLNFKVSKKKVIAALEQYHGATKRMEIIRRNNVTILNDTYNANPDSVLAALKTLHSMKVEGKKIVVLGDMLELGKNTEHEHAKIGLAVSELEFEYLLTFGPLSNFTHEASKLPFAEHFDTKDALVASLKSQLAPGDAVLVKGSRGMKMEEIVEKI